MKYSWRSTVELYQIRDAHWYNGGIWCNSTSERILRIIPTTSNIIDKLVTLLGYYSQFHFKLRFPTDVSIGTDFVTIHKISIVIYAIVKSLENICEWFMLFLLYFLLTYLPARRSVARTNEGENLLSFLRKQAMIFNFHLQGTYLPFLAWSIFKIKHSLLLFLWLLI